MPALWRLVWLLGSLGVACSAGEAQRSAPTEGRPPHLSPHAVVGDDREVFLLVNQQALLRYSPARTPDTQWLLETTLPVERPERMALSPRRLAVLGDMRQLAVLDRNEGTWSRLCVPPLLTIRSLLMKENHLWLADHQRLLRYAFRTGTWRLFDLGNKAKGVVFGRDQAWVFSGATGPAGTVVVSSLPLERNGELTREASMPVPPGAELRSVEVGYVDEERRMAWIGVPEGLIRIDLRLRRAVPIGASQGLPRGPVYAVGAHRKGLLVGSKAGPFLLSADTDSATRLELREPGASSRPVTKLISAADSVWFADDGCAVYQYDRDGHLRSLGSFGCASGSVAFAANRLWFAGAAETVIVDVTSGRGERWPVGSQQLHLSKAVAADGRLWLGSDRGLFVRSADGRWRRASTFEGLGHGAIASLAVNGAEVWLLHPAGIERLTTDLSPAERVALPPGLVSPLATGREIALRFAATDSSIWVMTPQNVFRFDRRRVLWEEPIKDPFVIGAVRLVDAHDRLWFVRQERIGIASADGRIEHLWQLDGEQGELREDPAPERALARLRERGDPPPTTLIGPSRDSQGIWVASVSYDEATRRFHLHRLDQGGSHWRRWELDLGDASADVPDDLILGDSAIALRSGTRFFSVPLSALDKGVRVPATRGAATLDPGASWVDSEGDAGSRWVASGGRLLQVDPAGRIEESWPLPPVGPAPLSVEHQADGCQPMRLGAVFANPLDGAFHLSFDRPIRSLAALVETRAVPFQAQAADRTRWRMAVFPHWESRLMLDERGPVPLLVLDESGELLPAERLHPEGGLIRILPPGPAPRIPRGLPAVELTNRQAARARPPHERQGSRMVFDEGAPPGPIGWLYSIEEARERGRREGKPVLLLFTSAALTAVSAREDIERSLGSPRTLFEDQRVIAALNGFLCAAVGYTSLSREETDRMSREYGIWHSPAVTFIDSRGRVRRDLSFPGGQWKRVERFLEHVRRVETTNPGPPLSPWAAR